MSEQQKAVAAAGDISQLTRRQPNQSRQSHQPGRPDRSGPGGRAGQAPVRQSHQSRQPQRPHQPLVLGRHVGLVFLGGVLGTAVRMVVASFQPATAVWPAATLSVNLIGALLLGGLLEFFVLTGPDVGLHKDIRLLVGTGVMGGFTTYGTFILEADARFQVPSRFLLAVVYVFTSIIVGLIASGIGINLTRLAKRLHLLRLLRRGRSGAVEPVWSADEFPEPDVSQADPDAENAGLHVEDPDRLDALDIDQSDRSLSPKEAR